MAIPELTPRLEPEPVSKPEAAHPAPAAAHAESSTALVHPAPKPKAPPLPKAPATPVISRINLRRIPAAVDPLGTKANGLETTLNPFRLAATNKVFGGLQQIQHHVGLILKTLQNPKLPPKLVGALHQPDGSAAARVQVQFLPSSVGKTGPHVTVLTGDDGGFTLSMPSGAEIPPGGLPLTVHGANSNTPVTIPATQISASGMVGVTVLPVTLTPLPVSILTALAALVPTTGGQAGSATPLKSQAPTVTIGEPGSVCVQSFSKNATVDRFPWGVFFRLVEPQLSIVSETQAQQVSGGKFNWLPTYATQGRASDSGAAAGSNLVDRIPIDQPLSVDGFRDQVAGIDTTGTFTEDETVPMAASLGLGYVLQMSQQWTFQGLGLGNLVYSLPLAPGEQQQVAVFERQDTSAVQESESFTEAEAQSQTALADTSTNATVSSAFNEMVNGGSQFSTSSSSSSWGASGGFSLGIISAGGGGGGGDSSSTGQGTTWLQGQRDATEQATQATHSSASNQAAARVSASRTGMRLATASENMDVTTKIITNHNHTHSLTMQYWEVHRIYDVTTTIDGLTLCCLIPMQIVRFMPPQQSESLNDPSQVDSHGKLLERYKNILRHLDVLMTAVPRSVRHGLTLLAQFAADPTTVVDSSGSVAEDVISFKLAGSFLVCENIFIAAITKRNTRVGPVQLAPTFSGQPTPVPANQFATRDDVVAWLTNERQTSQTLLQGSLALPNSINRSDIVGFEITRQFKTVSCALIQPAMQVINQLFSLFGNNPTWEQSSSLLGPAAGGTPQTVTLSASTLENLVGGPSVSYFYGAIEDFNAGGSSAPAAPHETYASDNLFGTVLPPQPFPVPALQVAPVLRYKDILEIEKSAQHVVRNTTRYSRALWMSMSAEERAILLDAYTIGVPPGGLTDASQMVPLLNCVQNKVLGTFGNSLIMPFVIPQEVAESGSSNGIGIDPVQIQQSLLSYQQETFAPPHSTISLPTKGVLGEAVLGHCASAEKIDLTRFWNWQDAPADTAPGIGMVQLPTTTPPLTTGVTAPNSLTNLPPLINNLITPPQPNTSLLQAMGQQATSQPDFSSSFTGQQQVASLMQNGQTLANQARSDALKTLQTLASQAMTTVGGLITTAIGAASKAASGAGGGGGSGAGGGGGTGGGGGGAGGGSGTGGGGGQSGAPMGQCNFYYGQAGGGQGSAAKAGSGQQAGGQQAGGQQPGGQQTGGQSPSGQKSGTQQQQPNANSQQQNQGQATQPGQSTPSANPAASGDSSTTPSASSLTGSDPSQSILGSDPFGIGTLTAPDLSGGGTDAAGLGSTDLGAGALGGAAGDAGAADAAGGIAGDAGAAALFA